jgi:hypothetical protein
MALKYAGLPLVQLQFSGDHTEKDRALRKRLLKFMRDHNIVSVGPHGGGTGADWRAHGLYRPDDARRVIDWLKNNGAELDPVVFAS